MPNKPRWNDAELRAAVAASTSMASTMRALGLNPHGGNHNSVKARIAELGLDTAHFRSCPVDPSAPWTDETLRAAVPLSMTIPELLRRLGVAVTARLESKVRRRLRVLKVDTAHFRSKHGPRRARWTDDDLRAAVAASKSWAAVLRALGLIPAGGNYDRMQRLVGELALDTSHFTGGRWSVGLKLGPKPRRPLAEVLVAGAFASSHGLKRRLFREGIKQERCELCGWAEMRALDGVIPLELDHVNGIKDDNRLENLRVLCPNCHALQPTHRGLNKKSKRARK